MMKTIIAIVALLCALYSMVNSIGSLQTSKDDAAVQTMSTCKQKVSSAMKEWVWGDAAINVLTSLSYLVAAYILFMMPRYASSGYIVMGVAIMMASVYGMWRLSRLASVGREHCTESDLAEMS